jgi:hypothetical protein
MGAQAKALLKMKHDEINSSDIGIQGGIFIGLTPIDVRALEDNVVRFVAAQSILDGLATTPGGLAIRDILPDQDLRDQNNQAITPRNWRQPVSGGWQGAQGGQTETQIYQTNKDCDNTQKVMCVMGIKAINGGPTDAATAINLNSIVWKRSNSKTIDIWHVEVIDYGLDRTAWARTPVLYKKGDNARIDFVGRSTLASGAVDNIILIGKIGEPIGKTING